MKRIAVVGTGYVGLVTGTCFAETGNNVVCIDIDEQKVEKMKKGEVPIYEPHLESLFERNIEGGRLSFTTSLVEGIKDAEIIFLALPTPPGEDGSADLSYILGVAEELGELIDDYKVIVDKSTVPVGTADLVKEAIAKNSAIAGTSASSAIPRSNLKRSIRCFAAIGVARRTTDAFNVPGASWRRTDSGCRPFALDRTRAGSG